MTASELDNIYSDRLAAARRAKAAGCKVAGFVSTAVPIELIEALGIFPVMVSGAGLGSTPLADVYMESMFDPMARAILQRVLSGELEFLDVLVIPRVADSFMRLYLYLREIERQRLSTRLPGRIVLYDLLQTAGADKERHNLAQLTKLQTELTSIGGREMAPNALSHAIESSNTVRRKLRSLLEQRRASSVESCAIHKILVSRYSMPSTAAAIMLDKYLGSLQQAANPPSPKILVAGNAQDNDSLYRLIDGSGMRVVGDFHWLGDDCAEEISTVDHNDPVSSLSRHYHTAVLTSRRFPHPAESIVKHAKQCGAQGVVFYFFEAEEALTWDAPNQVAALNAAGIPSLVLENQPYSAAPRIAPQLEEFATRLQGRP